MNGASRWLCSNQKDVGKKLEGAASKKHRQITENLITQVRCPVHFRLQGRSRQPCYVVLFYAGAAGCSMVRRCSHAPQAQTKTKMRQGMQLGADVTVVMATQDGEFRKPNPGMWNFFVEVLNGGITPGAGPATLCSLISSCRQLSTFAACQIKSSAPSLGTELACAGVVLSESFYVGNSDMDKCARCLTCKHVACRQSRPPPTQLG